VAVEDYPLDYANFEGVIPKGEYGAGTVIVWDRGTYRPQDDTDVAAALRKGVLTFELDGQKLKGGGVSSVCATATGCSSRDATATPPGRTSPRRPRGPS
jgi:DNA ligase D-like protein (predicted 3'-phosphoesterase)